MELPVIQTKELFIIINHSPSYQGDSGGPLITREDELSAYMLVGVVSGGTGRCGIGAPGIFTRVSYYKQWIIDNLK